MEKIFRELAHTAKERPVELRELKKQGKKIVQYTGNFIPAEMIYAAGAEPYLMCRGGEPEPPEAVLEYMLRFMNPLARSRAGYHLLGIDPVTPISDLIVTQQTDCHVGRVTELLEFLKLPIYKIGVPSDWKKDFSAEYYYRALYRLRDRLESLIGQKITDENLKKYFGYLNRINEALRNIDKLRKKDNPPLKGSEFIRLIHYSFFCEPQYAAAKLEELLEKLKVAEGKFTSDVPRILLAGHALAVGDYFVPDLIEELGAAIVAEMFDEGIRPYKWDIPMEGDLIRNFGETMYRRKTPPSIFQPAWKDRFEYLKQMIQEYRVEGVIWYQLTYDEIYNMECSCVNKWLREIKIPMLQLESSYDYSKETSGLLEAKVKRFLKLLKRTASCI
jgi:benzoyl-CoA reductase/2-hydroxyglutaryl-CoA dehydratase subunit BcrC/BadD/HgdB